MAKNPAKAAEYFQKALDAKPDFTEALIGLGAAKMDAGDLDGAQTAFTKGDRGKPDSADAQFNLGNVLFNKGKYRAGGGQL